jgi:hypothetical protein
MTDGESRTMGDIAGGNRFVGSCSRCLRSALARIPVTEDEDGFAETGRTREPHAGVSSPILAEVRLAGSMVVGVASHRIRAALASIPVKDDDGLFESGRAGEDDRGRRLALAAPALAGGLLAGTVAAVPAQAQESPSVPAQAQEPSSAPAQLPLPPPPPPPPPAVVEYVDEYAFGFGVPLFGVPVGGEVGILVHDDGRIQFTGMGGVYAGGKAEWQRRPARDPGLRTETKASGRTNVAGVPAGAEVVVQGGGGEVTANWKGQAGPITGGHNVQLWPELGVEPRGGMQGPIPGAASGIGALAASGARWTTEPHTWEEWGEIWNVEEVMDGYAGPIDPDRFDGQPPPEDPWVSFGEWVNDTFSGVPPEDPSWIEGSEIDQPAPPDWGQVLEGAQGLIEDAEAYGPVVDGGVPLQPGDAQALLQGLTDAAEAYGPGVDGGVPLEPGDSQAMLDALSQLWAQITGGADASAAPAPIPDLPSALDQLIAQDPALGQLLTQLIAQDPALAQLIAQDPALAQLLAQNPGLAQLLAQDPSLAPALSQALTPASAGEVGAAPGMDWGQIMQDMNGPVLVDPESFQDQPAVDTYDVESDESESADSESADSESDGAESDDADESDEFDADAAEEFDGDESGSDDDGGDDESGSDDDGGGDESGSDDDGGGDESGSDDDGGGDESGSDDDGGGDESGSDDDGGDDEGGDENADGGGGGEVDSGGGDGGGGSGGGGGGDDSAGDGGAPDALEPADPPDAGSEGGGGDEAPADTDTGDGYDYGDFDEGPGAEQDVGGSSPDVMA